jgi:hypothetical protein
MLLAAGPASAGPSGRFLCRDRASAIVGVIDFSSLGYRFIATDEHWIRTEGGVDATGSYDFSAPVIVPLDGPLLWFFGASGRLSDDGARIDWQSASGLLDRCQRSIRLSPSTPDSRPQ